MNLILYLQKKDLSSLNALDFNLFLLSISFVRK